MKTAIAGASNMQLPDQADVYEPRRSGSDNKAYVEGPGEGFGYDAKGWPDMRLSSYPDAKAAAAIANEAYRAGFAAALGGSRPSGQR